MYGKIFAAMYDGTLADDWQALVTFQQMIVLASSEGVVDMTPQAIARRTGIPLDVITAGIATLQSEDAASRTEGMDGRRIALLDEHRSWGWFIVNHGKYRGIASTEDKRAADRARIAKKRAKNGDVAECRDVSQPVAVRRDVSQPVAECRDPSQPVANVAYTDTDTDTEAEAEADSHTHTSACAGGRYKSEEFRTAWARWLEHSENCLHRKMPTKTDAQLMELMRLDNEENAIRWIEHSIQHSVRGNLCDPARFAPGAPPGSEAAEVESKRKAEREAAVEDNRRRHAKARKKLAARRSKS